MRVERIRRIDRDADARVRAKLDRVDLDRLDQQRPDPGGDCRRTGRRLRRVEIGEQDDELVAADARNEVRLTRRGAQPAGDLDEHLVAVAVAERGR